MKTIIITLGFLILSFSALAQIEGTSLPSIPSLTTAEMNGATGVNIGSSIFNSDEQKVYTYTSSGWVGSTDDQSIDVLSFNSSNGELSISLENDGVATETLDLSSLIFQNLATDNLTQDAETRTYDMNGQDLNFSNGSFGIGTTNPAGTLEARSGDDQNAFYFVQENGTTGEKDVFTIEDQDVGGGGQDESSVLKVLKSADINTSDNGFSLIELASTGSDPGANKYWISGRTTDEDAPLWGVDITDNDFWSEGGIQLGVTGVNGGTYSGGTFTVTNTGQITSSDLAGTGTRMIVADASGVLSAQAVTANTDNQTASEVNSDSPVDVDGDGNTEATVEDVIQDIAPITAASGRIFYPPSIEIDASTNIANETKDLYAEYVAQFASVNTIASDGAPSAVPIYAASELYYYVTYFDPAVFANIEISNTGVMEYDIIGQPTDYNSLLNVVFVVK